MYLKIHEKILMFDLFFFKLNELNFQKSTYLSKVAHTKNIFIDLSANKEKIFLI